jgi:hypothetical protein
MSSLLLEIGFEETLKRARRLLDKVYTWDGDDERQRKQTIEELDALIAAVGGLKP